MREQEGLAPIDCLLEERVSLLKQAERLLEAAHNYDLHTEEFRQLQARLIHLTTTILKYGLSLGETAFDLPRDSMDRRIQTVEIQKGRVVALSEIQKKELTYEQTASHTYEYSRSGKLQRHRAVYFGQLLHTVYAYPDIEVPQIGTRDAAVWTQYREGIERTTLSLANAAVPMYSEKPTFQFKISGESEEPNVRFLVNPYPVVAQDHFSAEYLFHPGFPTLIPRPPIHVTKNGVVSYFGDQTHSYFPFHIPPIVNPFEK